MAAALDADPASPSSARPPRARDGRAPGAGRSLQSARACGGAPGLVLVHGVAPEGKDDARLREAARLLARSGFAVAVPTVEGLTVLRLRPEDADGGAAPA